jgi:hypothetical protein
MLQNAVTAADVLSEYAQDIDKRQKELLCEDRTEVSAALILVERERLRPVTVKVCVLYRWIVVRIDIHKEDRVRQV